jgi:hypothetical protein
MEISSLIRAIPMPMRLVCSLPVLLRCIKQKYVLPRGLVLTVELRVRGIIAGVVGAVLHVSEDNEKGRERQLRTKTQLQLYSVSAKPYSLLADFTSDYESDTRHVE